MTIAASFAIARIVEQNLVTVDPASSRRPGRWARSLRIIATLLIRKRWVR